MLVSRWSHPRLRFMAHFICLTPTLTSQAPTCAQRPRTSVQRVQGTVQKRRGRHVRPSHCGCPCVYPLMALSAVAIAAPGTLGRTLNSRPPPKPPPPPAPPGLLWRVKSHGVHFYRIPKTGSSSLIAGILPKLRCESVTVHNHGDGCRHLNWCNGSKLEGVLPTQPVFVVMRHVCSRLESQWLHMVTVDPASIFGQCKTLAQFFQLLRTLTSHCPAGRLGVHCKVRAINQHYNASHRVILWPQAFYMAPRTMPICYHPEWLAARLQNQMAALGLCHTPYMSNISDVHNAHSNVRNPSNHEQVPGGAAAANICAATQQLYDEDDRLWHQHCDGGFGG